MTIYLDAIFLLNVLFDGCILLLVSLLTRQTTSIFRLFIGTLYAASSVFFILSAMADWFTHPIVKLLFSVGMVLVTFYPFSLRKGIQLFLTLYMVTFSLGGILIGLNYFLSQSAMRLEKGVILTANGGYGEPVTWLFVCTMFPIASYLYLKNDESRKVKKLQAQALYSCEFQFEHFSLSCMGLLDTGNQLVDSLTNQPVVILDGKRFAKEIPPDLFQAIFNHSMQVQGFDEVWLLYRLRWIPYQALGKKDGGVIGMEAKQLRLVQNGKHEIFYKVLVGFAPELLHTDEFSCILNPKIWIMNEKRMLENWGIGR